MTDVLANATVLVALTAARISEEAQSGSDTFAAGLLDTLCHVPVGRLVVAAPSDALPKLTALQPKRGFDVFPVRREFGSRRVARDFLLFNRWVKRTGADVAIYPHEWVPPCSVPSIGVLQNIGFLVQGQDEHYGRRGEILRLLTRCRAGAAAAIVSPSKEATNAAANFSDRLTPLHEIRASLPESDLIEQVPVGGPGLGAHDPAVVIVSGPAGYKRPALARELAARLGDDALLIGVDADCLTNAVRSVPRAELMRCFSSARVMVFPSLLESTGYPPIEALQRGAWPVISANTPMATFLAPYCEIVDSGSVEAWLRAVTEALSIKSLAATPAHLVNEFRPETNAIAWTELLSQVLVDRRK